MDSYEKVDFFAKKICRTCMSENDLISIFNFDDKSGNTVKKIMACADVLILQNDGLPSTICKYCMEKVNNAYDFRTCCEEIDKFLREKTVLMLKNQFNVQVEISQTKLENYAQYSKAINEIDEVKQQENEEENFVDEQNEGINENSNEQKEENCKIADSVIYNIHNKHIKIRRPKYCKEKPFGCEICGNRFTLRKNLLRHKRQHTQDTFLEKNQNVILNNEVDVPIVNYANGNIFDDYAYYIEPENDLQNVLLNNEVDVPIEKDDLLDDYASYPKLESNVQNIDPVNDINLMRDQGNKEEKEHCENITQKMIGKKEELKTLCGQEVPVYQMEVHMPMYRKKKSFECKTCGRQFLLSSNLRRHERIHTRETLLRKNKNIVLNNEDNVPIDDSQIKLGNSAQRTDLSNDRDEVKDRGSEDGIFVEEQNESMSGKKNEEIKKQYKTICSVCGKEIITKRFKEHMRRHTNEKSFECKTCGHRFFYKRNLHQHEHVHTRDPLKSNRKTPCYMCGKEIVAIHLKRHIQTHTQEKPFECNTCGHRFTRSDNLRKHEMIHTNEILLTENANATLNNKIDFQIENSQMDLENELQFIDIIDHVEEVKNQGIEKVFFMKDIMEKRSENKKSTSKTLCYICGKQVIYPKQHMLTHTKEKPFECKTCGFRSAQLSAIRSHERGHTGEKPYKCGECGKKFTTSSSLRAHLLIHSNDTFKCRYCGKYFKQYRYCQIHIQRKHTNPQIRRKRSDYGKPKRHGATIRRRCLDNVERPFICDICGQRYISKTGLYNHQLLHNNQTFCCDECGKCFRREMDLQKHMRIHTGEKLYTCNVCNKAFTFHVNLKVHEMNHTGEKPHQCTLCEKKFRQSTHLKRHLKLHTGDKPFGCMYCGRSFAQKANLTVHIRRHTGEMPFLCPVCGKGYPDSSSMKKHHRGHDSEVKISTQNSLTE